MVITKIILLVFIETRCISVYRSMCKLTAPTKDKHLIITWQKPVLANQAAAAT